MQCARICFDLKTSVIFYRQQICYEILLHSCYVPKYIILHSVCILAICFQILIEGSERAHFGLDLFSSEIHILIEADHSHAKICQTIGH